MGNQGGAKMPGNLPIKKFRSANIEAAIWSNKRDVEGASVEFKTLSLSRSYKKSKEDVWRNEIINLRRNDIQRAIIVLKKAQEEMLLNDEKGDKHEEE